MALEIEAAGATILNEARDDERIRHFPCEGCGADLAFVPGDDALRCHYCGLCVDVRLDQTSAVSERDLPAALARQAERRCDELPASLERLEVRCPSCSARVVFQGTLTAQRCAYCTGPIQRADVHRASDRVPVDAVLHFTLDRDQAQSAIADWLRSRWFAPARFTRQTVTGGARSVFVPYWTFDALTATRYRGRAKRAKETFWKKHRGVFRRVFDDLMVVADRTLDRGLMRALEPWPLANAAPYRPECLTGHLARTYDLSLAEGWKHARQRIENAIEREVRSRIGGDAQRIDELTIRWDAVTYKHVLVPIFVLAIPYGQDVHRIVVNGATGEVSGSRPWSLPKIAAFALLVFVGLRLGLALAVGAGLH